jgi:hypothetical protein
LPCTARRYAVDASSTVVRSCAPFSDTDGALASDRTSTREHLDAGADHVAVQVLPAEQRGVPEEQWRALAAPLTELDVRRRRQVRP